MGGKKYRWIFIGIRFVLVEMTRPKRLMMAFFNEHQCLSQKENPEEAREKGARNGT